MKIFTVLAMLVGLFALQSCSVRNDARSSTQPKNTVRVASFNVGFDRYRKFGSFVETISSGRDPQAQKVAEIIQRVDADILLINEIDGNDEGSALDKFHQQYLQVPQNSDSAVNYPYRYQATCNTGIASGFDLDNNGKTNDAADAWGFGFYEGQYCFAILSKYPIDETNIRSFQQFRWQDMPEFNQPTLNGKPWYSESEFEDFPLSSKNHVDVPILVSNTRVHILAAHPTPPVFDGKEDRNGKRNFDEIRLLADYIDPNNGSYLYDDSGNRAVSLTSGTRFVVMGDLNASDEKRASDTLTVNGQSAIEQLFESPWVNAQFIPESIGARENAPKSKVGATHTAAWKMRADYVLPSKFGLEVEQGGVFWPAKDSALGYLVNKGEDGEPSSSDHRLVWLDLKITEQ